MWKAPVLLWVLGSAWLWVPAQGSGLEDNIVTPGTEGGMVTPGIEDIAITGATEEPHGSTGQTALVSTTAEKRTKVPIQDLSSPGSSAHDDKENRGTTSPNVATGHSVDKTSHPDRDEVPEETEKTDEKDGLAIVTLVGIIVGVLLAIGFTGGIIIVIMRKISGRFSP